METKRVTAVYFSPCGNAGKIAERIAASMAEVLQAERATVDFTPVSYTHLDVYKRQI